MIKGKIHSCESFGSVDGPGVRYLIFLQGCPMRCRYCHNPDTWDINGGEELTPEQLIKKALRYKEYWGNEGGITVSGGEPLLQIDFLIELFKLAKDNGINTCIDTSAQPFSYKEPFFSKFNELMEYTDLLLVDIKHIDNDKHKALTGRENKNILACLSYLSKINKPIWIRHVLVPDITDNNEYLKATKDFIDTLNNVKKVEVLPYHSMGEYKWKELGYSYSLTGVEPPSENRVKNAREFLGAN